MGLPAAPKGGCSGRETIWPSLGGHLMSKRSRQIQRLTVASPLGPLKVGAWAILAASRTNASRSLAVSRRSISGSEASGRPQHAN